MFYGAPTVVLFAFVSPVSPTDDVSFFVEYLLCLMFVLIEGAVVAAIGCS